MSEEATLNLLDQDIEEILKITFPLTSTKPLQHLGVSLKEGEKTEKN